MDQAHIDHDGRVSSPQVDDPQQQQILGSDGAPSRKKGRAYAQQAYDLGRGGNTAPNGQHAGQMNQTPVQFSGYPSANPYEAGANPTQGGPGLAPHYGYGQSQPQQSDHRQPEQGYQPPSSQNYGVDQGYDQLNDRFEQMGIAGGQQQPQPQYQAGQHVPMNRLQPSDLVNQPFNVAELDQPPPPIVLPPNVSSILAGGRLFCGANESTVQRYPFTRGQCASQVYPVYPKCCTDDTLSTKQIEATFRAHHQSLYVAT